MDAIQSFQNQFLVSLPSLNGDYFEGSISLLVDHNEDGAFGLMINRPLEASLTELLPQVAGNFDCPVLEGGPVEQNRVFFLHDTGTKFEDTFLVNEDIGMTTSPDFVAMLARGEGPAHCLAILGYAGWGSQQLEEEIGRNAWLLTPASAEIVFNTPFEERPRAAAKLLGIDLNLLSPSAGHD